MNPTELASQYGGLKSAATLGLNSEAVARQLVSLARSTSSFLRQQEEVTLTSKVPGKQYFAFSADESGSKLSRAVNAYLFDFDAIDLMELLVSGNLTELPPDVRTKLLYTVASCFFSTVDLLKDGDQKTPATYFEILVGHLLGKSFGTNPRNQIEVLRTTDKPDTLPTDFIFELGPRRPTFNVGVKTSTRERIIQLFAHQQILNSAHGVGHFTGLAVCFAETKVDRKSRTVTEICVPKQLRVFQMRIAQLFRIYYFDVPAKYAVLADQDPPVNVREFTDFFVELEDLTRSR